MTIATGLNTTSDMLRRLLEQQKTPTLASSADEIQPATTGTKPAPTLPGAPTTSGGITQLPGATMPISVAPRPRDPGFWNTGGTGTYRPPTSDPQPPTPTPGLTPTTTEFGPGDNMIGSQINLPETSREELVQRMFNAVTPEMDRQASLRREDLSRRISGLGRAGMGGVNTSFGNLEALESQRRSELLGKLSAEGAAGDISDMFRRAGFMVGERGYQHGLEREAVGDQMTQASMLAQLGYGFDPTQSGNFTNSLMAGQNYYQNSANANQGAWNNLANVGTQMMFR
jgi:hypothetical protein